ncbi:ribosome-associated translation inhibitor RaiA [bacterium]|nr:ribosome-associated translation inhibitor RaiA [bacterium]
MHIYVNGRNIEITDAIKSYVKEKIGKVATHYDQIHGIEVVLSVIKNPAANEKNVAEVTCKLNNSSIHLEETAESMYASIDLLSDKLLRQVQKYKDKALTSKDKTSSIRTEALPQEDDEDIVVEVKAIED